MPGSSPPSSSPPLTRLKAAGERAEAWPSPATAITWALLLTEYISWLTGIGRSQEMIKLRTWRLRLASREIGEHSKP